MKQKIGIHIPIDINVHHGGEESKGREISNTLRKDGALFHFVLTVFFLLPHVFSSKKLTTFLSFSLCVHISVKFREIHFSENALWCKIMSSKMYIHSLCTFYHSILSTLRSLTLNVCAFAPDQKYWSRNKLK